MSTLIYPSKQEPVQIGTGPPPAPSRSQREFSQPVLDLRGNIGNRLDHSIVYPWGAQTAETVTVDRSLQPLSKHPGFKPALLAALQKFDFLGYPPLQNPTADKVLQPFSKHPGFLPGLLTAAQRADWFGRAAPFPETPYLPARWPQLNEPVRLLSDLYLKSTNQKAFFFTPFQFAETPYVPARWPRLNEPVREMKDKYLSSANQKAFFFTQIQFREVTFIPAYWPRFNEPVRLPKGLNKELQIALLAVQTNIPLPNPNLALYNYAPRSSNSPSFFPGRGNGVVASTASPVVRYLKLQNGKYVTLIDGRLIQLET